MVQSYLRHGPTQAFGLVCSSSSNSVFDGRRAYVPALEDVLVWDVKKGEMLAMWHDTGHRAEVTCIRRSPKNDTFAVGYADGSIRLWSAPSGDVICVLNGHKKALTALAFDDEGTRLASGSQDTELIIWDVLAESGLVKLRGHRDQITAIHFVSPSDDQPSTSTGARSTFLLTTSKDTFIKLWDLNLNHCIQTVVAHRAEIWAMALDPEQSLLFTGSSEGEMKAWRLDHESMRGGLRETDSGEVVQIIHPITKIPLSSSHRVSQITFHPTQPYLAVQSHDRSVEVFRVRTQDEIRKKQMRRKKRAGEKGKAKGKGGGEKAGGVDTGSEEVKLVDLFEPYLVIRATGKVRSFDFGPDSGTKGGAQILTSLANNALEIYTIPQPTKAKGSLPEATRTSTVDLPGHRTDVRTLSLSSDDRILASASNGSLKIWNMKTTACIRTLDCGYAICSTFLPGDRHIAIGTKSGEILIYDLASSSLIQTVEAHSSTVWSLHVHPNEKALASGSADKEVKFWEFEHKDASEDSAQSGKTLSLVHVRTLKMTDEVLAVKYSPNGKLLAVSLLDSTVKVFYQDSLKFFLSLYGHKLPVLAMDISSDSKLIVTCSADKNVKIWGLDFGDCHKSIFAHDESVMQVAFEKDSHYFWTVGKDSMLKYWDGDKFESIQKLEGHHGEIWALVVSNGGNFVVTGSHDKSIRVWEKLDEPLFLEEERERELEQLYEIGAADALGDSHTIRPPGESQEQAEVGAVTKPTSETLMAGERIVEAIDLADNELAIFREYEQAMAGLSSDDAMRMQAPPRNPVLAAYDVTPEAYVLQVIEKIPNAALLDALLTLPFQKVMSLMGYLSEWAKNEWNIILSSRIILFLLRTHHHQVVTNHIMRTSLIPLRKHLRSALTKQKDVIGYNLAALRIMQRRIIADHATQFVDAEPDEVQVRSKVLEVKKRKRVKV
ncbi:WD-repeat-containing protein [Pleurotus eryngii]|uniref:WD-repeat-containing protein n=1 Tax=Pleurotus eryngii TaxID=5323 RepID=A0A9P6A583_PLEER|nr:WD-repeat-containing protein [Pleurotus eryngii]